MQLVISCLSRITRNTQNVESWCYYNLQPKSRLSSRRPRSRKKLDFVLWQCVSADHKNNSQISNSFRADEREQISARKGRRVSVPPLYRGAATSTPPVWSRASTLARRGDDNGTAELQRPRHVIRIGDGMVPVSNYFGTKIGVFVSLQCYTVSLLVLAKRSWLTFCGSSSTFDSRLNWKFARFWSNNRADKRYALNIILSFGDLNLAHDKWTFSVSYQVT